MLVGFLDRVFHLNAKAPVFTHEKQKLAHELVALILKKLMAAHCGNKLALELRQLHSGGVNIRYRHYFTLLSAKIGN
jgi:hypothetical protein